MATCLTIDDFDSFKYIRDVAKESINDAVLTTIANLNEKTQLEPFIRSSIFDLNDTLHGPMEIVDILTTKVVCQSITKYSAFILKGKSFKRITGQDISHQIYRLRKIGGLEIAILAYTGSLLDQPQEEFISTCKDINVSYSIWNTHDIARLLISEGFICPRDGNIIEGNICSCGYNPRRETLNIFQEEAIKELKLVHRLKLTKGLVILPTGSGKTRVAALDIKNNDFNKVIYIAHTNEILESAFNEFTLYFDESELTLVSKKVQLTKLTKISFVTIQLLSRHLNEFNKSLFDYIIVDEFHHSAANSYNTCLNYFRPGFLLGLTATPFRSDRKDISEICDNKIIVNYELRDGIETGILSPYNYYGYFDSVDYSKIKYNGIAYDISDLEKALVIQERNDAIIKKWKEKAINKATIGFCCSQLHAQRCHENFTKNGIKSAVYVSLTSPKEREKILHGFRSGKIKVIFTVDVLNEGVDFPFVECLLFLRPTESKRIFLQQLGRGLRRFHGKSKTIILDFIGNFSNAYRIVEYFGLSNFNNEDDSPGFYSPKTYKQIFNLPLGCEIFFDEKVINVFSNQIVNSKNITRHNIHKILIQQFLNLCIRLNKIPTWKEINRACIIDSRVYKIFYKKPKDIAKHVEEILIENGIKIE